MTRLLLTTTLVALSACAQQPVGPAAANSAPIKLVSITQGGELAEIERAPEYSIVEVRNAPSGSVASSLFALRGACAVARARGQNYFASTPVTGKAATYRISFPTAPSASELVGGTKSVFTLAECQQMQF